MNTNVMSSSLRPFMLMRVLLLGGLVALATGCTSPQVHSTVQVLGIDLKAQDLKSGGIAFLTPSSATGQEEDKQALALAFTEVMQKMRPSLHIVPLSATLSAINREGLSSDYKQMFEDYHLTGILDRDMLKKVAGVTGVRYLAQLKLGGFRQESKNRWGALGFRILDTKSTTIRLFLQIWDSKDGSIVWESAGELTFSHDSLAEDTVTFKGAVEESARDLISRLPWTSP